ncbi:MAG: hypothetical protein AAGB35_10065 [Pseudomonadota bacterium]
MKYSDIRGSLKTGDMIAFSGNGLISNLIKWKTNSPISHVAIVLSTQTSDLGDFVFICESTTLTTTADAITKELWQGVQIQLLSSRINHYDGDIYIHPLTNHLSDQSKQTMVQWLRKKHQDKTPYDSKQALGSGLDLFDSIVGENTPDFSSLFCSELVTKALQLGGAVSTQLNPSEMTPVDCTEFSCFDQPTRICR